MAARQLQRQWGGLLFLVAGMLLGRVLTGVLIQNWPWWSMTVQGWTAKFPMTPVIIDTAVMAVIGALILGIGWQTFGFKLAGAGAEYGGADW